MELGKYQLPGGKFSRIKYFRSLLHGKVSCVFNIDQNFRRKQIIKKNLQKLIYRKEDTNLSQV